MSIISAIVAVGERNGVIGRDGGLPWSKPRLPPDMKWFVERTAGHPVIMGRSTMESIPAKYWPLDRDRPCIVLSTTLEWFQPEYRVARSIGEALHVAKQLPGSEEIFIAGGAQVYLAALPYLNRIYKTLVDEDPEGDTFFPEHPDIMREVASHVVPDFVPRLTMKTYER